MKRKTHENTPFEKSLSSLQRTPLPEEWKTELIETAIGEVAAGAGLSPVYKLFLTIVACCWVVIFGLEMTMPDEEVAPGLSATSYQDSFPLLVRYMEMRNNWPGE